MLDFINYPQLFIPAILIVLSVSISAALLSPFMVLNEQSLIADGLAHMSFTGIILGVLLASQPFIIAIPFAIMGALIVTFLQRKEKLSGDAALGLVSAVLVAIGLIIIRKTEGFPMSVESILIGNMWTAKPFEIIFSIGIMVVIIAFISYFYKKLVLLTYDTEYAKFKKYPILLLQASLASLTALFTVIGVKSIGALLISALLIFPTATANLFVKSFKQSLFAGIILSILTVLSGFVVSHLLDIPTAATIIVIYAVIYISIAIFKNITGGKYATNKE